jgi:DNA helicase II / ATP-dependent DNA helicase PcrA
MSFNDNLFGMSGDSLLDGLNQAQKQAVSHLDGPLLIIAGAGSGKTKVLTHRLAYLLDQKKARASQVLALTFTNKAAREMRERIQRLIGDEANHLWMGTFHSIFSRILRYEAEAIGYRNTFSIYDSEDSEKAIRNILKELNFDPREIKPSAIKFRISSAKNALISSDEFSQHIRSTIDDVVAKVYPIYENRLIQSNAMDFDDLLIKPIQLFEQNPDVLERWHERFRYIMIDEYQDTNRAQYKVTSLLSSKYRNLCVVGDDAQSIYSFRGADISNILDFQQSYPDAARIPLEQNYRSTSMILRCADSVIKQNSGQLDKTLWTENEQGEPVTVMEHFDEREESNRIASHMHQHRIRTGYQYNEYAILYRTNYQSRLFEEAFRRKGIPYQLVGGVSFYQRKEVKDVIAYLKLLVNPNDEEALLRVINEPARGIGDKTMADLIKVARDKQLPLWDVIKDVDATDVYKPAKSRINEFTGIIDKAREQLGQVAMIDTVRALMEQTGYVQQYITEGTQESLGRRENIVELMNAIAYFEQQNPESDLAAFLQDVSLVTDADALEDGKPAVTLMTVHAAKGLEFNVVFIVGLEDDLFPIGARVGEETDLEEERRLFYVAITRAKKELFMSHARSRFRFGEQKDGVRSRFINEIDPAVIRSETGGSIRRMGSATGYGYLDSTSENRKPAMSSGTHVVYDDNWKSSAQIVRTTNTSVHYDPVEGDPYQPGSKVLHPTFGPGKILAREGQSDQTKVTVFFQGHGQKKLMLKFAKLKPM